MERDYAFIHNWLELERTTRQEVIRQLYRAHDSALGDTLLALLKAPAGFGIYASMGPLYSWAIFGRDSIVAADNLLSTHQELAQEIILLLARLQGVATNPRTEEEPGKIHHEYRARHFNGDLAPAAPLAILEKLGPLWGGTHDELCYYGSYDSTPLFIRLVGRYCALYGSDILETPITGRDRAQAPLRNHVHRAASWLAAKIQQSEWCLFEYKRLNPQGLYNQAWADSNTAYLHLDTTVANADGGVAAIELQGYAYEALLAAAAMGAGSSDEAAYWQELAKNLQQQTLSRLWMPEHNYFAMGLDRDPGNNNQPRFIATLSSNAALLLGSKLLTDLPAAQTRPYIEGVARIVMSEEFLTPAGLRLRARRHAKLLPYADYHGSYVTWPKATYAIAEALRLQKYDQEADLLEDRILESVLTAGEFYEFFLVTPENKVKYHYRHQTNDEPQLHDFGAANQPEPGQAWTLSAVLRILETRKGPQGIRLTG